METTKKTKENNIFAFFKGFASAFNISGRTFVKVPDLSRGFERDGAALRGDWERVGADMRKAISLYSHEQ